MILSRPFGGLFFLFGLYYLGFFVFVRQEPFTVAQTAMLWGAALLLILQRRPASRAATTATQGWALVGAGMLAAVALFIVVDGNSHSASDTIGLLPAYSLLLAVAIRALQRRSEQVGASPGRPA
ncbi:MAG TPA: hypothetical protein VI789_06375 [Dehalococcoidia bacterium]|nr:hypothetical protein [Dehalococcoidia bacterium]